jgi:hypothetical protein
VEHVYNLYACKLMAYAGLRWLIFIINANQTSFSMSE